MKEGGDCLAYLQINMVGLFILKGKGKEFAVWF